MASIKNKKRIGVSVFAILFGFILMTSHIASADTFPNFPMAFWGNVTVDGAAAPAGTIIRAYYGTTLAGQVTVQEAGIYGYIDSTKQKLLVAQGDGAITFTVQSDSLNSGAEASGTTPQTKAAFVSGDTENLDLAFTLPAAVAPTPAPSGGGGGGTVSSGGGGGGGGGGGSYFPTPTPAPTPTSTTTSTGGVVLGASTTNPVVLLTLLNNLLAQLKSLEKQFVTQKFTTNACSFSFTHNLSQGMTSSDVKHLQQAMNFTSLTQIAKSGVGSPGNETGYFGAGTKNAVISFQNIFSDEILAPAGLTSGNGLVGPGTRAELNKLCSQ